MDRTTPMVAELACSIAGLRIIRYEKNRGKGYAVRLGIRASGGDLVLLTGAGLSTPMEEPDSLSPYRSERGVDQLDDWTCRARSESAFR